MTDISTKVKYPIVQVTWYDAESHDDWDDISTAKTLRCKPIVTVGFLVEDNDDGLVMAMQVDPINEKMSMVMVLPNHWIEKIEHLTIGD